MSIPAPPHLGLGGRILAASTAVAKSAVSQACCSHTRHDAVFAEVPVSSGRINGRSELNAAARITAAST
jgi:hypothetical protein